MTETYQEYRASAGAASSNGKADGQDHENVSAHIKDDRWAETKLHFWTAREIGDATPAQVNWIAEPWIAAGCLTSLDGKVKAAGKTTWLTHLCRAKLDGLRFMGKPTKKGPIVYLTEQPQQSFRRALEGAGLLDRDDFHVVFWHEAAGVPWPEVVEEAAHAAREFGADLIIVDVISRFAGIKGEEENSSGAATEAMTPIKLASAAFNLAFVIVRHDGKADREVGDSGRGSSAYSGEVDIVLSLRRPGGNAATNVRVMHALSRFDETPERLVIQLTDDGYVPMGTQADYAASIAEDKLRDVLPSSEEHAQCLPCLVNKTGCPRSTIQRALVTLISAGEVVQTGTGKSRNPHRFWRP